MAPNDDADASPLRVVQWATGNIGLRALREVIRDPRLELVGVVVHDAAKAGIDAGTLCGEGATGVTTTVDTRAIHALQADCVLYMPRVVDVDDLVELLAAGTNVVTTCVELFDEQASGLDAEAQTRIRVACTLGGASLFATGSSPGFITHMLPITLLALQRRVDRVELWEFADMSRRDSPHMLFEQIGFGKPMPAGDENGRVRTLATTPPIAVIAEAAGRPADSWSVVSEAAAARTNTSVLAGEIAAGTVGARRMTVVGQHGGEDVVQITYCWYLTADLDPAWDVGRTGWRAKVHGDAPFDVDLAFPIPLDDLASFTPAYTANLPVNAVPYVCAAPPGMLSAADLPPIVPAGPAVWPPHDPSPTG